MGAKNRTVWVVAGIAALTLCLCVVVAAVAMSVGLVSWPLGWSLGSVGAEERVERSFEVGDSPILTIDNYAGRVTVYDGEDGEIRVPATRHTRRAKDLEWIAVQFDQNSSGLSIQTGAPLDLMSS